MPVKTVESTRTCPPRVCQKQPAALSRLPHRILGVRKAACSVEQRAEERLPHRLLWATAIAAKQQRERSRGAGGRQLQHRLPGVGPLRALLLPRNTLKPLCFPSAPSLHTQGAYCSAVGLFSYQPAIPFFIVWGCMHGCNFPHGLCSCMQPTCEA